MAESTQDIEGLAPQDLKRLLLAVLEQNAALRAENAALREEIARLKGLQGRPKIPPSKPSGMETATERKPPSSGKRRRQPWGQKAKRVPVEEQILEITPPTGSRFKGYEDYVVQELVLQSRVIRYRRQRWETPAGETIVAPLPAGICGHYGPELRRFVVSQHHEGQVTVRRLAKQLQALGIEISKRQVVRLLNQRHDGFHEEARDVLRAGLTSPWISVDDTAPDTRRAMASAPRSATRISPGSAPPARRAGSISWSCCGPVTPTT
jgi:hypothetical protein